MTNVPNGNILCDMNNQTESYILVKVSISPNDKARAKALAKSQGMTFQGWLGQLIKRELAYNNVSTPSSSKDYQVFPHEPLEGEGFFNTGRD